MNSCPACGSSNTWDDMTMWGCSDCGWMGSNMYSVYNKLTINYGGKSHETIN